MSSIQNAVVICITTSCIYVALSYLSMVNQTATSMAWFDKGISPRQIEKVALNNGISIATRAFFKLLVHLAPVILLYTSVTSAVAGISDNDPAEARERVLTMMVWCTTIPGVVNLVYQLVRTKYASSSSEIPFVDALEDQSKSVTLKRFRMANLAAWVVNAGLFVSLQVAMAAFLKMYVDGWNFNQSSVVVDCLVSSAALNVITFFFTTMNGALQVELPKIEGKMRPNTIGALLKDSAAMIVQNHPLEEQYLRKRAEISPAPDRHLPGSPLVYTPSTTNGFLVKTFEPTISDMKEAELQESKGVQPGDWALTLLQKNGTSAKTATVALMTQDGAQHLDNTIGGPIAEFAKMPSVYQHTTKIGLSMKKEDDGEGYAGSEKEKEYKVFSAKGDLAGSQKLFSRVAVVDYTASKKTFTYFMYDVMGFGVGWGTYMYTTRALVVSFILWIYPFFMALWLDIQDGIVLAFPITFFTFIFSMIGRVGNFFECFCYAFLISFFSLFSARAFGFNQSVLGPWSDASINRNDFFALCGPQSGSESFPYCYGNGNPDGNATLFALSVTSVAYSAAVLAYTLFKFAGFRQFKYGYVICASMSKARKNSMVLKVDPLDEASEESQAMVDDEEN